MRGALTDTDEKKLWQKLPSTTGLERAETLVEIAKHAYQRGASHEVLAIIEQAREIYLSVEAIAPREELVDLYEGLGHTFGRLNRYPEASESIKKAVELLEGEAFAPRRSHLVKVGAHLAFDGENWEAAREAFAEAAQIDEMEGETYILAEDLFNLGSTHIELSQYDEAISCYEKAANLYREFGDIASAGHSYQRAAESYLFKGLAIEAEVHSSKAIDVARVSRNRFRIAYSTLVHGKVKRALGELEEAMALIEESLSTNAEFPSMHWNLAVDCEAELATIARQLGEEEKANEIERRLRTLRDIMADDES